MTMSTLGFWTLQQKVFVCSKHSRANGSISYFVIANSTTPGKEWLNIFVYHRLRANIPSRAA